MNAENIISGSAQVTLSNTTGYSTFSSSLATTDAGQDNRLSSIEGKTGSYATTGSNIFIGNQTITGSLYVSQDLIIAGSSSIQHISSSVVNIADNIITVNAQNPAVRFGGLAVIDSGSSPQVSGSLLFMGGIKIKREFHYWWFLFVLCVWEALKEINQFDLNPHSPSQFWEKTNTTRQASFWRAFKNLRGKKR